MLREVLEALNPQPSGVYVDTTLGAGGHSYEIASRIGGNGRLIGIDQDTDAIEEAKRNLDKYKDRVTIVHARFDEINRILNDLSIDKVNGILFDLGVSSFQLDTPDRGFSFKDPDALLDMRMNKESEGATAADLLNTMPERELAALIRDNSDEKWAARIAKFVVERRREEPITKVGQLINIVHSAIPVAARPPDTHAATRTFQSLRIAVNEELNILGHALESAVNHLASKGVIVTLSYHSLEDRIIKQLFTRLTGRGGGEDPYGNRPPAILQLLHKKPVLPSAEEVHKNPRARSAKLRAAIKI